MRLVVRKVVHHISPRKALAIVASPAGRISFTPRRASAGHRAIPVRRRGRCCAMAPAAARRPAMMRSGRRLMRSTSSPWPDPRSKSPNRSIRPPRPGRRRRARGGRRTASRHNDRRRRLPPRLWRRLCRIRPPRRRAPMRRCPRRPARGDAANLRRQSAKLRQARARHARKLPARSHKGQRARPTPDGGRQIPRHRRVRRARRNPGLRRTSATKTPGCPSA